MISDDAFLRRLPNGLSAVQALRIEALVYSADAIEASLASLKTIASAHDENIMATANRGTRLELFISAWTIVDCVHVVRQMLRALEYATPLANEFLNKYEVASSLRNKMDHLKDQSQNLANKNRKPPLFGTLGYVYLTPETVVLTDGIESPHGATILLTQGRIRGNVDLPMLNPADVVFDRLELESDFSAFGRSAAGFRLSAFEEVFDLHDAARDLSPLMAEFEYTVSTKIPPQLEQYAKDNVLDIDEVMGNAGAGFSCYAKF